MLRERRAWVLLPSLYAGLLFFSRRHLCVRQAETASAQALGRGKKPWFGGSEGTECVFRSQPVPRRQRGRLVCSGQRPWLSQIEPGYLDIWVWTLCQQNTVLEDVQVTVFKIRQSSRWSGQSQRVPSRSREESRKSHTLRPRGRGSASLWRNARTALRKTGVPARIQPLQRTDTLAEKLRPTGVTWLWPKW